MPQTMTKDNQWKTTIQGLALGCLVIGVDELPGKKMNAEFAFSRAWRSWTHAAVFPSVSPDDFFIYLGKSSRRNGAFGAWNWGQALEPYVAIEGWEPDEALEAFADEKSVPSEAWAALARMFIDDLTAT